MKLKRLIIRIAVVMLLMGFLFYMNSNNYSLWAVVGTDVILVGFAVEMLIRALAVEKYQLADREEDQ